MIERGSGSIIHTSSGWGILGGDKAAAYFAAKGGLVVRAKAMAIDHVTLVTVADDGVAIANLRMSGIFDKTGVIPAEGDTLCFEDCK